jgi:sarcosine oxidase subunit gamma
MPVSAPQRCFPLSPDGAAAGTSLSGGAVALTDLTALPRFGIKGPGSAAWLAAQGIVPPAINRIGTHNGMLVLRFGGEDFLILAEMAAGALDALAAAWHAQSGARGYWSWREEGWAWMRLSGAGAAEAMARLCALDLRVGRFGDDEIAQTRVGHLEAVLLRSDGGFDVLFDITATAYFVRTVTAAAEHCAGDTASREN